jgi:hypothetical protein
LNGGLKSFRETNIYEKKLIHTIMFKEVRGEALAEKAAATGYNYGPGRHGRRADGCISVSI